MDPRTYICVEGQEKFSHQLPGVSGDMGEALSCGCAFRDGQPNFLVGELVFPTVMEGSHVGEGAFRVQSVYGCRFGVWHGGLLRSAQLA